MADKRPFFKLDVGYFGNPKIQSLMDDRPRAILLHLECIAYSRQHLTDGLVPVRIAMRTVCAKRPSIRSPPHTQTKGEKKHSRPVWRLSGNLCSISRWLGRDWQ